MSFGGRLKQRRNELGLSQDELSFAIDENLSRQTIAKWEADKALPAGKRIITLAAILDISLDDLFYDEILEQKRSFSQHDSDT